MSRDYHRAQLQPGELCHVFGSRTIRILPEAPEVIRSLHQTLDSYDGSIAAKLHRQRQAQRRQAEAQRRMATMDTLAASVALALHQADTIASSC